MLAPRAARSGTLLTVCGRKLVRTLRPRRADSPSLTCSLNSQPAPKLGDSR
jgi:hypothetical protein